MPRKPRQCLRIYDNSHWRLYKPGLNTSDERMTRLPFLLERFMQDIKNSVRKFLLDNFVMGGNVTIADDTSLMKAHILDSTGFIELILFIEESFGVKVDDAEMLPENFDSLLNIDGYIGRKRTVHASN